MNLNHKAMNNSLLIYAVANLPNNLNEFIHQQKFNWLVDNNNSNRFRKLTLNHKIYLFQIFKDINNFRV